MKRLILVNTLYQMVVAIQLKNTSFTSDSVSLLISDHVRNGEEISQNVRRLNIFESVGFIKTKGVIENRKGIDKLKDFYDFSFKDVNRYGYYLNSCNDLYYDEFLCYNFWTDTYGLYSILYQHNKNITFSFFEEGILSYHFNPMDTGRRKTIRIIRKLLGKKSVTEAFGGFYCFYPELYHGDLKPIKIAPISSSDPTALQIRKVFDIKEIVEYNEKYIFFSSVYDIDGDLPIGEFDLLLKISEIVGRENLIVKVHPRDTRSIYKDNGLKVDTNSGAPWEAILLSGDFSSNVFLTTASSSVLAGALMLPNPSYSMFLYKLCDYEKNGIALKAVNEIEKTLNNQKMEKVFSKISIANTIEDLLISDSRG